MKTLTTLAFLAAGLLCLGTPDTAFAKSARERAAARPATHHAKPRHVSRARDTRPLVVIDPGHGGKDPGAIGAAGTQEKSVTLATAQDLARELRATGRYRVILTRADDRFVPLQKRLAMSQGAAMFISLHADASRDRTARGASVYARSGATARTAMFHGTARLQQTMIDNLDDDVRMTGAPAREARLHVLANPTAPSVLVEIGFISNRQDEAQLRQPRHRATIAAAIRDAVEEHFAEEGMRTRG
jgi:N-acetylmuramoyl-L-alanine amidase